MISRTIVFSACLFALAAGAARAQSGPLKDPIPAPIPLSPIAVRLQPVATGLNAPIFLQISGEGDRRKFVVDQTGRVLILKDGSIQPIPFLDISGVVAQLTPAFPSAPKGLNPGYDERGLLGLAFHPGFWEEESAGFQTLYTMHNVPVGRKADFPEPPFPNASVVPNCQEVIAEWKVSRRNPDLVDPSSYREILRFDRPEFNHNGGTIAFGPDGKLYASIGDGGAANDVGPGHNPQTGNAQDLTTILGKVIRIDPLRPAHDRRGDGAISGNGQYSIPADNPFFDRQGVVKEVYAYGLRNPFRMSFDRKTGSLVLADVGQNNIEEVDFIGSGGNYGWHVKEGTFLLNPADGTVSIDTSPNPLFIDPVVEYDHNQPSGPSPLAIIGGFVYRGSRIRELRGKYVCGDLSGILFVVDLQAGTLQRLLPNVGFFIKGFGQDEDGELYVLGSALEGPSGAVGMILAIRPVGGEAGGGDGNDGQDDGEE